MLDGGTRHGDTTFKNVKSNLFVLHVCAFISEGGEVGCMASWLVGWLVDRDSVEASLVSTYIDCEWGWCVSVRLCGGGEESAASVASSNKCQPTIYLLRVAGYIKYSCTAILSRQPQLRWHPKVPTTNLLRGKLTH
jgi:hypothetical protein